MGKFWTVVLKVSICMQRVDNITKSCSVLHCGRQPASIEFSNVGDMELYPAS
jgi:hypothetical protein